MVMHQLFVGSPYPGMRCFWARHVHAGLVHDTDNPRLQDELLKVHLHGGGCSNPVPHREREEEHLRYAYETNVGNMRYIYGTTCSLLQGQILFKKQLRLMRQGLRNQMFWDSVMQLWKCLQFQKANANPT